MLVYTHDGYTFNVPADTIALGAYGTSAYPPVIANGGLMGAVSSGSMNPYRTSTFGYLLVQTDGGTTKVWSKFNNQAAAQLAYDNIGVALQADETAIILAADGTYSIAS